MTILNIKLMIYLLKNCFDNDNDNIKNNIRLIYIYTYKTI